MKILKEANLNRREDLQDVKAMLDGVSPSMCLAKWLQVTVDLENGLTHSCHHPPRHKIPIEELEKNPAALHNTSEKIKQRQQMLNGERPAGCNYCWRIEDSTTESFSDRITKSASDWSLGYYQNVIDEGLSDQAKPTYLEVMFSKKCNLACMYCMSEISSSVDAEAKKFGMISLIGNIARWPSNKPLSVDDQDNPHQKAFHKWFPSIYENLKYFRITGGEPLLDKATFKYLDYVASHPNPDLSMAINSNLCAPDTLIDKAIVGLRKIGDRKSIKALQIFASVDTWGDQAEYIRKGLNYKTFIKNLERMLIEVPGCSVTIMCTFNLFSIPHFKKLLEQILEIKTRHHTGQWPRLVLDIAYLRDPNFIDVKTLDRTYYQPLYEAYEYMKENSEEKRKAGFSFSEINRMKYLIDWALNEPESEFDRVVRKKNFKRFVDEMDRRYQSDFKSTFPELVEFYNSCGA